VANEGVKKKKDQQLPLIERKRPKACCGRGRKKGKK